MAAPFSDYLANALLNHVFRKVTYAPPAGIWVALYSDVNGDTELTVTNYARKLITFAAPDGRAITNTGATVVFEELGAGSIRSIHYVDAASGAANKLLGGALDTPITITAGENLSIDPGNLTIRFKS